MNWQNWDTDGAVIRWLAIFGGVEGLKDEIGIDENPWYWGKYGEAFD